MAMCEKKNAKMVELLLTGKDIDPNLLVSVQIFSFLFSFLRKESF